MRDYEDTFATPVLPEAPMRHRFALLAVPVLLLGLLPGSVSADPSNRGSARHQEAVAFWTPERIRSAIPRDITFDPADGFVVAGPGANRGKPQPKPTPTPTPPPPDGTVTGAPWTADDAVLAGTGRVFFVMGAFLYSCSGTVATDGRADYSLVLTAGHCVIDRGKFATMWTFIPGYDTSPVAYNDCTSARYGCWTADALFVDSGFASQKRFNNTAVQHDFAFALVGPGGKTSVNPSLETAVGGSYGITFSGPAIGSTLSAFGYPAGAPYNGTDLTYCSGPIGQDPNTSNTTWSMACDMTGGSSGGPWLSGDPTTFAGATLRSLNSYGYSGVDNMYGPKFNSSTEAVYNAANGTATSNTIVP
ncbi:MAG: hypothetical protein ABIQ17_03010 [Candidatus Limnocylindrales bacterium]